MHRYFLDASLSIRIEYNNNAGDERKTKSLKEEEINDPFCALHFDLTHFFCYLFYSNPKVKKVSSKTCKLLLPKKRERREGNFMAFSTHFVAL